MRTKRRRKLALANPKKGRKLGSGIKASNEKEKGISEVSASKCLLNKVNR